MRWSKLPCGTQRIRSGFLWFPKRLQNETRWLERAVWVEMYGEYGWSGHRWNSETPLPEPHYQSKEEGCDCGGWRYGIVHEARCKIFAKDRA